MYSSPAGWENCCSMLVASAALSPSLPKGSQRRCRRRCSHQACMCGYSVVEMLFDRLWAGGLNRVGDCHPANGTDTGLVLPSAARLLPAAIAAGRHSESSALDRSQAWVRWLAEWSLWRLTATPSEWAPVVAVIWTDHKMGTKKRTPPSLVSWHPH